MMERVRTMVVPIGAILLIGLGVLNAVYRDTLLTWQPFPEGVGGRVAFATTSAVVFVASGIGLLLPQWRPRAAGLATAWLALDAIAFHLPHLVQARDVGALLGIAEAAFCALGFATLSGWLEPGRRALALRVAAGLCMIVFGLSHYVYADFTAQMVPAWLPQHLVIAYLTGTVHLLTGLCLLGGFQARIAATAEALMMTSFVLLLHIPGVAAAPHERMQLTMLGMAGLLTCAAWLVATWPALPEGWSRAHRPTV